MAKLTLSDLSSLSNQTSAIRTINDNSTLVEEAIENTLSRDGTSPNTMYANLDMNGFSILNQGTVTDYSGGAANIGGDINMATGTKINWANSDVTLTHATDNLSLAFDSTDKTLISKLQDVNSNWFAESGETTKKSSIIFKGSDAGDHIGNSHALATFEYRPVGTGENGGSNNGDVGVVISNIKKDYATTSVVGGNDCLYIVGRSGGPTSDQVAILADVGRYGTGFTGFAEAVTNLFSGGSTTNSLRTQIGILDNVSNNYFGYFASSDVGNSDHAFWAATNGGTWTNLFRGESSGVAVFNVTGSGAVTTTSSVLSSSATAGIGYATGAGGTVTQATSKSTGVTLNKVTGQITLNNAALAADTTVSFTLTNSAIAATDLLILNHISGGTAGSYLLNAQAASGSASINVRNITAGSLGEAIVIQFVVIKGVNA